MQMTRSEAAREEAVDLIEWATEFAPDLLPEDWEAVEDWAPVLDAIRNARFAARPRRPADLAGGYDPEPF